MTKVKDGPQHTVPTHLQVCLWHDDHKVDEEGHQHDVLDRVEDEPGPNENAVLRDGRPDEQRVGDHQHYAQRHWDGQEVARALQEEVGFYGFYKAAKCLLLIRQDPLPFIRYP